MKGKKKIKPLSGPSFHSRPFPGLAHNYRSKVFRCNGELLFFREEKKGFASISSADAKNGWYLPFSTSCKLALARDVAVKPI